MKEDGEEKPSKPKFKKKTAPVVKYLPTQMENKFISKAEFLKRRASAKIAQAAADEAYRKSLAGSGVTPAEASASDDLESAEEKVGQIKAEIVKTTEALNEKPESKTLMKKLEKLQVELTDAENAVEELEK